MNGLNRFTVNGKTYTAEDIDFLFMTYLDKCGVPTENMTGPAAINCYFAYCSGLDEKKAAKEITEHVINNGGKLPEELTETYVKLVEESGFFRAIMEGQQDEQTEESETTEQTTKKKTTRKASE